MEEETPIEEEMSLRDKIKHLSMFMENLSPFYAALFPQLDMTEGEIGEFLGELDEEALFEEFFQELVVAYEDEENLEKVADLVSGFIYAEDEGFLVAPKLLDEFLHKKDTKVTLH